MTRRAVTVCTKSHIARSRAGPRGRAPRGAVIQRHGAEFMRGPTRPCGGTVNLPTSFPRRARTKSEICGVDPMERVEALVVGAGVVGPGGGPGAGAGGPRDHRRRGRPAHGAGREFAQQRGHPRRPLLRARLAQGAVVRARQGTALRLLCHAWRAARALRQAGGGHGRGPARGAAGPAAAGRRPTACRCSGWRPLQPRRWSLPCTARPRCCRPAPASSTAMR